MQKIDLFHRLGLYLLGLKLSIGLNASIYCQNIIDRWQTLHLASSKALWFKSEDMQVQRRHNAMFLLFAISIEASIA
jgi:hypothetical protein